MQQQEKRGFLRLYDELMLFVAVIATGRMSAVKRRTHVRSTMQWCVATIQLHYSRTAITEIGLIVAYCGNLAEFVG